MGVSAGMPFLFNYFINLVTHFLTDNVPVDKKWNELIKYNIFIMKLIEFVISMILLTLPFALPAPEIFHCLAAAPTLMLSFMFIILYLVDQNQNVVEQLYLASQITLNICAILQATFLKSFTGSYYGLLYFHLLVALCIDMYYNYNEHGCLIFWKPKKGLALLLCIMPNIVDPIDSFYCLASAPTLMISFQLIVLYVVDQVQPEAEFYYLVIQLFITTIALLNLIIVGRIIGAVYGLFYVDLIIAFIMDLNYIRKQHGFKY